MTGPTATATPVIAPQTPNAVPRSRPWKALPSSASEVENIAAPPIPWAPRARLSHSGVVASPESSELTLKMTRPMTNTRRRPNRSASDPVVSSSAASVSA